MKRIGLPVNAPTFSAGIRISLAGKLYGLLGCSILNQSLLNKPHPSQLRISFIMRSNVVTDSFILCKDCEHLSAE